MTSPGPWRWDEERRRLMSPNPEGGKGYPPEPRYTDVLSMPDDYSQPPGESDARLIAKAPQMAAMLRKLEWGQEGICPSCMGYREDEGHWLKCELEALLRELPK